MAGFIDELRAMGSPHILELGVRRSVPEVSTLQKHHYPFAGKYVGTDFQDGPDVDVVADIHTLSKTFGEESFDGIVSQSVFEHVKYPFLAAHEILKTLRVGGHTFIGTHLVWHEHGYPHDYFRFTCDGLKALFPRAMGAEVRWTEYAFPCEIHSDRVPWNPAHAGQAFLNVHIWVTKREPTPREFTYEL